MCSSDIRLVSKTCVVRAAYWQDYRAYPGSARLRPRQISTMGTIE